MDLPQSGRACSSSSEGRYLGLAQLLAAYFHQDWDLDDADADAVVRRFIRSEPPGIVRRAREDIGRVLTKTDSDAELETLAAQLGSMYLPAVDGLTMRSWLTRVGEILAAAG